MLRKIFCFAAGLAGGFAACLVLASMLPDENRNPRADGPRR